MATNQTIVTTLMADPRGMQRGFADGGRSADKLGTDLARLDKTFQTTMNRMSRGPSGVGRGLAGGFLELSRGIEDASIGYQLNGIQGAVRGASNNFSQMAFVMGGPVLGAVVGLTAAALPALINYFTKADDKAKKLTEGLERLRNELSRAGDEATNRVRFQGLVDNLPDSKELESQIRDREQKLKELDARRNAFDEQRRTMERPGTEMALADLTRREKEVREAQNKDLSERIRLENELNVLISKRTALQEQDDWAKRLDAADEKTRKDERDLQQLESLLGSRMQQLGGKVDPLEDLNVPRHLRGQIGGLLGEIDEMNRQPRAQFAQVATAGSQSLLRAQFQAKEAAEAKQQRAKLLERLNSLITEIKGLRNDGRNAQDGDDVNLN